MPNPPDVSVMLLVLRLIEIPVSGLVELVRVTVLAKPFRLAKVMFVVPVEPWLTSRDVVDAMLKSTTVTVIVTWWDKDPLDAVTVMVYVPATVVLNDRVADKVLSVVRLRLAGVRIALGPDGLADTVRVTVPLKWLRLDARRVVETVAPAFVVRFRCGALKLKS